MILMVITYPRKASLSSMVSKATGRKVLIADNFGDALLILERESVELFIMDAGLTDIQDEFERLAQKVKQHSLNPNTKTIYHSQLANLPPEEISSLIHSLDWMNSFLHRFYHSYRWQAY